MERSIGRTVQCARESQAAEWSAPEGQGTPPNIGTNSHDTQYKVPQPTGKNGACYDAIY